jgi:hypothetical protein
MDRANNRGVPFRIGMSFGFLDAKSERRRSLISSNRLLIQWTYRRLTEPHGHIFQLELLRGAQFLEKCIVNFDVGAQPVQFAQLLGAAATLAANTVPGVQEL